MEQIDDFEAYKAVCTQRLRRLERYKKARSLCFLDDEVPSTAQMTQSVDCSTSICVDHQPLASPDPTSPTSPQFEVIREKMFSLMENDMNLLKQLLSLGDQITQMKESKLKKSRSTTSLDDNEENEDEFEEKGFSASMSAVTTLYVDDSKPQYFSRQNSVLRIPIPPRSSNRFGARNLSRRPSEALRAVPSRNLRIVADDSSSESSDSAVSPLSHTPSTVSHDSTGSRLEYSTSSLSTASVLPAVVPTKNRSSNSSIDSGIRDSPSPTSFEERKI